MTDCPYRAAKKHLSLEGLASSHERWLNRSHPSHQVESHNTFLYLPTTCAITTQHDKAETANHVTSTLHIFIKKEQNGGVLCKTCKHKQHAHAIPSDLTATAWVAYYWRTELPEKKFATNI